jgi:hypothetical protein
MRIKLALFGLLLLGPTVTLIGCHGDNKAEVTGIVKVDGEPIKKGIIGFSPVDGQGQTAGGAIIDGKYSVKSSIGLMKVEIRYPKVVGKKKDYDAPGGKFYDLSEESLPPKYNNDSKLTFDVKRGVNEKDWSLQTK